MSDAIIIKETEKVLNYAPDQFFNDRYRQIDFILAYEQSSNEPQFNRTYREFFHRKLESKGLQLERTSSMTADGKEIFFVKLHAPFHVLAQYAQRARLKLALKGVEKEVISEKTCLEKGLGLKYFSLPKEFLKIYEVRTNLSARFHCDKLSMFQPFNDKTFFHPSERIQLVWYILCHTQSLPDAHASTTNVGVHRLLQKKIYIAAYPIHDGGKCFTCDRVKYQNISDWNFRRLLHRFWQSGSKRLKHQPMILIRDYFGCTVSFYFAWLGCYTRALLPAAIFGVICFIFGSTTTWDNQIRKDVCFDDVTKNITMCPNCPTDTCLPWKLEESCLFYTMTLIFANETTIPYAVFICLWSSWFLVYWQRREAELRWHTQESNEATHDDKIRIEYEELATTKIRNPVTGVSEPHVLRSTLNFRKFVSVFVTTFMILLNFGALLTLIFLRVMLLKKMNVALEEVTIGEYKLQQHFQLASTVISSILSLILIIIGEWVYRCIAVSLTYYECPRTSDAFESSFIYKMIAFQFINYYMPLFYVAFFKGRFRSPAVISDEGFFTPEDCALAGCMSELFIQLLITMCIKQLFFMVIKICSPRIQKAFRKSKKFVWKSEKRTQWEKDFVLIKIPEMPLVDEYVEMVVQFGFVSLFSVAFPLSALFAFINNIFELRSDAKKWTYSYRRPVPQLAYNIGPWFNIIKGISIISVFVNASVVSFTGEIVPRLVYDYGNIHQDFETGISYINYSLSQYLYNNSDHETISCSYYDFRERVYPYKRTLIWWHVFATRLAFMVVFIVTVYTIQKIITFFTPKVPRKLDLLIRREQFLAWQLFYGTDRNPALADNPSPPTPSIDISSPQNSKFPGASDVRTVMSNKS